MPSWDSFLQGGVIDSINSDKFSFVRGNFLPGGKIKTFDYIQKKWYIIVD